METTIVPADKLTVRTRLADTDIGPVLHSPADRILALLQEDLSIEEQMEIIETACFADPGSPMANLALAEFVSDEGYRRLLLNRAFRVSERLFREYAQGHTIRWWDDIGTRPMLRIGLKLAESHFAAGDVEQAEHYCSILLDFDPLDRMGTSYLMDTIEHERAARAAADLKSSSALSIPSNDNDCETGLIFRR